ncbi:MAG: sensor domain-containing diguanylate cyclase [Thermodesulfobacteriota bacterium]
MDVDPANAISAGQWSIAEDLASALALLDRKGVLAYCNRAMRQLFGDLAGKRSSVLFRSEEEHRRLGELTCAVADENAPATAELLCMTKDGPEAAMEASLSPWRGPDGAVLGAVVLLRDISSRKRMETELKAKEVRYRELFENMSSGVAIYEAVDGGRDFVFKDFNRAAEGIERISRKEVIGRRVSEVFPGVAEFGLLDVFRSVAEDGAPRSHPVALYRDRRIMGWRENSIYRLPSGEIVAIYNDVTEQKKAEMALAESEVRLRAIMESIHAGIVVIDPSDHRIVYANPMALKVIGAEWERVAGNVCHKFICPNEVGRCPITDLGQKVDNAERKLLNIRGEPVPILKTVSVVTLQGRDHLLESFLDISQLKALECKLREMATVDALTGAASRGHFMELFQKEVNRSLRYDVPLSLAMLDIDHFKKVNDTYGHQGGDAVLKNLCLRCRGLLRDNDVMGRIGGEEFAILLVENDLEGAVRAAERIRQDVMGSVCDHEGTSIACTVSLGVAQFGGAEDSLDKLVKRADAALYRAKSQGRNRVCRDGGQDAAGAGA